MDWKDYVEFIETVLENGVETGKLEKGWFYTDAYEKSKNDPAPKADVWRYKLADRFSELDPPQEL